MELFLKIVNGWKIHLRCFTWFWIFVWLLDDQIFKCLPEIFVKVYQQFTKLFCFKILKSFQDVSHHLKIWNLASYNKWLNSTRRSQILHDMKAVYMSFLGPYSFTFKKCLSKCAKMRTRKAPNTDNFFSGISLYYWKYAFVKPDI